MTLKPVILFLSFFFTVLLSLSAIAEKVPPTGESIATTASKGAVIEADKAYKKVEKQQGTEDCSSTDESSGAGINLPEAAADTIRMHSDAQNHNLSFNFMYYVLFKFKYMDIFGLSNPAGTSKDKRSDNITWH